MTTQQLKNALILTDPKKDIKKDPFLTVKRLFMREYPALQITDISYDEADRKWIVQANGQNGSIKISQRTHYKV